MLSKLGDLPVVTFRLAGEPGYTVFDISEKLRERGWIVPAYTMAPNAQDIAVLRVVVIDSLSRDMVDMLLADIQRAVATFEQRKPAPRKREHAPKTRGVC